MRNPGPISDYADALARELSFDRSLARCVLQEVEEHLWEAAATEPAADRDEAQRRAVARFGDPRVIAAQFATVSLATQARKLAAIAIFVIGGAYALMKARLAWYAAARLVVGDDLRSIASVVARIDGYAFWLSVAIGIVAWIYIGRRRVPMRITPSGRKELLRFFILCGAATTALTISAISDAVLTGLRVAGMGWSPALLLPVALMAAEIAVVAALAFLISRTAFHTRDFTSFAAPAA